jgi:hypothetical protein
VSMGFKREDVASLLAQCHRRCCICHRFCGVKMETDHMDPKYEKGSDEIENAIPLCFECHAEVHLYNDKHGKGRKYTSEELRKHKEQWLEICLKYPQALVQPMNFADGGPFYGLVTELEFNILQSGLFMPYQIDEFLRSIKDGTLVLLREDLKGEIMATYALIKSTNQSIKEFNEGGLTGGDWVRRQKQAGVQKEIADTKGAMEGALNSLNSYLNKTVGG